MCIFYSVRDPKDLWLRQKGILMERWKEVVYSGPGGAAVFEMDLDTQIRFPVGPSGKTRGKRRCSNTRNFV